MIAFAISMKNVIEILIGIALNLYNMFGSIANINSAYLESWEVLPSSKAFFNFFL